MHFKIEPVIKIPPEKDKEVNLNIPSKLGAKKEENNLEKSNLENFDSREPGNPSTSNIENNFEYDRCFCAIIHLEDGAFNPKDDINESNSTASKGCLTDDKTHYCNIRLNQRDPVCYCLKSNSDIALKRSPRNNKSVDTGFYSLPEKRGQHFDLNFENSGRYKLLNNPLDNVLFKDALRDKNTSLTGRNLKYKRVHSFNYTHLLQSPYFLDKFCQIKRRRCEDTKQVETPSRNSPQSNSLHEDIDEDLLADERFKEYLNKNSTGILTSLKRAQRICRNWDKKHKVIKKKKHKSTYTNIKNTKNSDEFLALFYVTKDKDYRPKLKRRHIETKDAYTINFPELRRQTSRRKVFSISSIYKKKKQICKKVDKSTHLTSIEQEQLAQKRIITTSRKDFYCSPKEQIIVPTIWPAPRLTYNNNHHLANCMTDERTRYRHLFPRLKTLRDFNIEPHGRLRSGKSCDRIDSNSDINTCTVKQEKVKGKGFFKKKTKESSSEASTSYNKKQTGDVTKNNRRSRSLERRTRKERVSRTSSLISTESEKSVKSKHRRERSKEKSSEKLKHSSRSEEKLKRSGSKNSKKDNKPKDCRIVEECKESASSRSRPSKKKEKLKSTYSVEVKGSDLKRKRKIKNTDSSIVYGTPVVCSASSVDSSTSKKKKRSFFKRKKSNTSLKDQNSRRKVHRKSKPKFKRGNTEEPPCVPSLLIGKVCSDTSNNPVYRFIESLDDKDVNTQTCFEGHQGIHLFKTESSNSIPRTLNPYHVENYKYEPYVPIIVCACECNKCHNCKKQAYKNTLDQPYYVDWIKKRILADTNLPNSYLEKSTSYQSINSDSSCCSVVLQNINFSNSPICSPSYSQKPEGFKSKSVYTESIQPDKIQSVSIGTDTNSVAKKNSDDTLERKQLAYNDLFSEQRTCKQSFLNLEPVKTCPEKEIDCQRGVPQVCPQREEYKPPCETFERPSYFRKSHRDSIASKEEEAENCKKRLANLIRARERSIIDDIPCSPSFNEILKQLNICPTCKQSTSEKGSEKTDLGSTKSENKTVTIKKTVKKKKKQKRDSSDEGSHKSCGSGKRTRKQRCKRKGSSTTLSSCDNRSCDRLCEKPKKTRKERLSVCSHSSESSRKTRKGTVSKKESKLSLKYDKKGNSDLKKHKPAPKLSDTDIPTKDSKDSLVEKKERYCPTKISANSCSSYLPKDFVYVKTIDSLTRQDLQNQNKKDEPKAKVSPRISGHRSPKREPDCFSRRGSTILKSTGKKNPCRDYKSTPCSPATSFDLSPRDFDSKGHKAKLTTDVFTECSFCPDLLRKPNCDRGSQTAVKQVDSVVQKDTCKGSQCRSLSAGAYRGKIYKDNYPKERLRFFKDSSTSICDKCFKPKSSIRVTYTERKSTCAPEISIDIPNTKAQENITIFRRGKLRPNSNTSVSSKDKNSDKKSNTTLCSAYCPELQHIAQRVGKDQKINSICPRKAIDGLNIKDSTEKIAKLRKSNIHKKRSDSSTCSQKFRTLCDDFYQPTWKDLLNYCDSLPEQPERFPEKVSSLINTDKFKTQPSLSDKVLALVTKYNNNSSPSCSKAIEICTSETDTSNTETASSTSGSTTRTDELLDESLDDMSDKTIYPKWSAPEPGPGLLKYQNRLDNFVCPNTYDLCKCKKYNKCCDGDDDEDGNSSTTTKSTRNCPNVISPGPSCGCSQFFTKDKGSTKERDSFKNCKRVSFDESYTKPICPTFRPRSQRMSFLDDPPYCSMSSFMSDINFRKMKELYKTSRDDPSKPIRKCDLEHYCRFTLPEWVNK